MRHPRALPAILFVLSLLPLAASAAKDELEVVCVDHMVLGWTTQREGTSPDYCKLTFPKNRVTTSAFLTGNGNKPFLVGTVEHDKQDLRLFDVKTGRIVQRLSKVHEKPGLNSWSPEIVATDAKSRFFITVGGLSDPVVHFFDGAEISASVKLSPPERRDVMPGHILTFKDWIYVVRTNGKVEIWRVNGNEVEFKNLANLNVPEVTAAGLSPDGDSFLIAGKKGVVLRYAAKELATPGRKIATADADIGPTTRRAPSPVDAFHFAGNNVYCSVSTDEGARVVKLKLPRLEYVHDLQGVAVSGETDLGGFKSETVLSVSSGLEGAIRIYDGRTGAQAAQIQVAAGPNQLRESTISAGRIFDAIQTFALSKDGKYLVAGTAGGNFSVWELATSKLVTTFRMSTDIRTITFSDDGKWLFVGAHHGNARLYKWRDLIK